MANFCLIYKQLFDTLHRSARQDQEPPTLAAHLFIDESYVYGNSSKVLHGPAVPNLLFKPEGMA